MTPTSHGLILFERLVLAAGTLMMTMIALRTLYDPIGLTHALGIALSTPTAITVVRVGFGGFALGFAIVLLYCLISTKRLLAGVSLVAVLMAAILVARIQGLIVDGVTAYNLARLPPEVVMLTLSVVAIALERRRRREGLVVA
jgi:hypothetical protein